MSNEVLNTYIKYGQPEGDDLTLSEIADWAGYLLMEQKEQILELEAQLKECRDLNEELATQHDAIEVELKKEKQKDAELLMQEKYGWKKHE